MSEYFEWSVGTLNISLLQTLQQLSDIDQTAFDKLVSYYILVYENPTSVSLPNANAECKDGYLPPLLIVEDDIIFSPLAARHMYTFNNLLFSVKEKQKKLFDEHISQHLEPVLILQTQKLFQAFGKLQSAANIIYQGGGVDLMLLDKKEKICLAFQMKANIVPTSCRSVARVQGRSEEGMQQIQRFRELKPDDKLNIIKGAFQCELDQLKVIDVLMVRSSAGQEGIWNSGISIINYDFLSGLLGKKLADGSQSFADFEQEIISYMDELIKIANVKTSTETLSVGDIKIYFPDQEFDDHALFMHNLKMGKPLK